MPIKTKCVYAGSFDPPTNGHLWMIREGAKIFDELVVAIGLNTEKRYTFTVEERLAMLSQSVRNIKNARVEQFENRFLVDYAKSIGARFILRGIRDTKDYEYEKGIRSINSDIDESVTTIFLIPPSGISSISSSLVKGLVGSAGWERVVSKYVPRYVLRAMLDKYKGSHGDKAYPDIGEE